MEVDTSTWRGDDAEDEEKYEDEDEDEDEDQIWLRIDVKP